MSGAVLLRLILRSDGRVDDKIDVLKSLPYGLTEEAIKVAKQIEFVPAEKDGRKVSQYVTIEYNFNVY
jgi:TonB family protein